MEEKSMLCLIANSDQISTKKVSLLRTTRMVGGEISHVTGGKGYESRG